MYSAHEAGMTVPDALLPVHMVKAQVHCTARDWTRVTAGAAGFDYRSIRSLEGGDPE